LAISEQDRSSMEKYALQNAVRHGGRAEVGAVVSKVLGDTPGLRSAAREVAAASAEVVKAVNAMTPAQQEQRLMEKYPEALEEHKQEQRVGLPPLEGAEKGKLVVRLPPEPSGFMHIGHAMAGTINDIYREMYEGKLWLRFEDTNPRKVQERYYESFRKGYGWLGIKWDFEKNVSSDVELIYEHVQDLLEAGSAYACACPPERVKQLRFDGVACEHRDQSVEKNLAVWDEMLGRKHKEGTYVVRLKGDLSSLDYSLRDPNIARIIDFPHPLTKDKFVVWPTYDFEVVVEDEVCSVTHVLRSSEFHVGLQELIRKLLGFPEIHVEQFSRFNFKGTPVQKRLLRPLVEQNLVSGWDDPRMPTIEGVIRRGILPQAIRQFTTDVGYTKSEHTFDWSLLFAVNRKLLDPVTRRYYFVPEAIRLSIELAPLKSTNIPYHPVEKLGSRVINSAGEFYVPSADVAALRPGQVFRLMELFNVEFVSSSAERAFGRFAGDDISRATKKVQWVVPGRSHRVEVLEPSELYNEDGSFNAKSLTTRVGFVEESATELQEGDIVQFPRYGFVRIDAPGTCVLAHN